MDVNRSGITFADIMLLIIAICMVMVVFKMY